MRVIRPKQWWGGLGEARRSPPPQRGSAAWVPRAAKQLAAALRHRHTRKENDMTRSATTPLPDEFTRWVDRANASGKQPVIFAHGLWLLDSSREAWAPILRGGWLRRGHTKLS